MKWIQILRKGRCALLQNERDSQYAVVSGYNPDAPEDEQWTAGNYFPYWDDANRKVRMLQSATDYFRSVTENGFISRSRLIELATLFKDCEMGDEDMEYVLEDMTEEEKVFFGLESEDEDEGN